MTVLEEVAKERQRQIKKGFDDDAHTNEELAYNAIDVIHSTLKGADVLAYEDDLGVVENHPEDGRKRLIIAIALLVAEVERKDREYKART